MEILHIFTKGGGGHKNQSSKKQCFLDTVRELYKWTHSDGESAHKTSASSIQTKFPQKEIGINFDP